MDKQTTINLNLGKLTMGGTSGYQANKNQNKLDHQNICSFNTIDELQKFVQLRSSTRNYALYLFNDRYSTLFIYPIKPSCNYTSIFYTIMDTTNDRSSYNYTTNAISTAVQEEACIRYIKALRQLVSMNAPPNLALMHRTNKHCMCEIVSTFLIVDKYSRKNSRDIIFQVLAALMCIYECDAYINNLEITVVALNEPINLVYNVGSIKFELKEVICVPILRPQVSHSSFNVYKSGTPGVQLEQAYNSTISNLKKLLSEDMIVPSIHTSTTIIESILSYLLMEYEDESNLCSFEPISDDPRISNKYKSRACLLKHSSRGNVYYDNNMQRVCVQVSDTMCYIVGDGITINLPVADMTRMISIKDQQPSSFASDKRGQPTIRTFVFKCS